MPGADDFSLITELSTHRFFFKGSETDLEIDPNSLIISHVRQQGPERVRRSPRVTQRVYKVVGRDPRLMLSPLQPPTWQPQVAGVAIAWDLGL